MSQLNSDPHPSSGLAVYPASTDGYEDSVVVFGRIAGTPEAARETACVPCFDDQPTDFI